jgi:GT2 family glycosyltransferase
MTNSLPTLAIIVVTWNVRDLALACLESVYADVERDRLDVSVWLVDNASSDGIVEAVRARFPRCRIIASERNLGFAGGNNAALRAMGFPDASAATLPDAVLLLNPDTVIRPGALRTLLDFLRATPGAGIAGARLFYGDGSFQHSAFAFPGLWQLAIDLFPFPGRVQESRLNGRYPRALYEGTAPFPIDHPLGAAMMVRREAIQQVGLLDEDFYVYCEEIDWAMRVKRAGWSAYCVPNAEVVHYGGQSTSQVRPQSIVNLWTSRLRLYDKTYNPLKRSLALAILRAGMNRHIRTVARDSSLSEETQRELVTAYQKVLKLSRGHRHAMRRPGQ